VKTLQPTKATTAIAGSPANPQNQTRRQLRRVARRWQQLKNRPIREREIRFLATHSIDDFM